MKCLLNFIPIIALITNFLILFTNSTLTKSFFFKSSDDNLIIDDCQSNDGAILSFSSMICGFDFELFQNISEQNYSMKCINSSSVIFKHGRHCEANNHFIFYQDLDTDENNFTLRGFVKNTDIFETFQSEIYEDDFYDLLVTNSSILMFKDGERLIRYFCSEDFETFKDNEITFYDFPNHYFIHELNSSFLYIISNNTASVFKLSKCELPTFTDEKISIDPPSLNSKIVSIKSNIVYLGVDSLLHIYSSDFRQHLASSIFQYQNKIKFLSKDQYSIILLARSESKVAVLVLYELDVNQIELVETNIVYRSSIHGMFLINDSLNPSHSWIHIIQFPDLKSDQICGINYFLRDDSCRECPSGYYNKDLGSDCTTYCTKKMNDAGICQNPSCALIPHSHWINEEMCQWQCNSKYYFNHNQCKCIIPKYSIIRDDENCDNFECIEGYRRNQNSTCECDVPLNSFAKDQNNCLDFVCLYYLHYSDENTCDEIPDFVLSASESLDNKEYNIFCGYSIFPFQLRFETDDIIDEPEELDINLLLFLDIVSLIIGLLSIIILIRNNKINQLIQISLKREEVLYRIQQIIKMKDPNQI